MGIFDGIEKAEVYARGAYIEEGSYILRCKSISQGESRKGEGPYCAYSGEVVRVIVAYPPRPCSIVDGDTAPASNALGAVVSWSKYLRHKMALGDVKAMLAANTGLDIDDITAGVAERYTEGEGAHCVGALVRVDAVRVPTQRGTVFTRTVWSEASAADLRDTGTKPAPDDDLPF